MSEIINATYEFLDALDNSELINNLTKYKNKAMQNKDLLNKIKDARNETNSDLLITKRKEIYDNDDYKMYMKYYNELSLIVLKINNQYKKYTSTKEHSCHGI